jgi:hypothetical protein
MGYGPPLVAALRGEILNNSQIKPNCSTHAPASLTTAERRVVSRRARATSSRNSILRGAFISALLVCAPLLITSCGSEPPSPSAAETPAKPAESPVPDDIQTAAQGFLGKETKVLLFGDLAKNGKQQFLAANVVPKTPKNENLSGTIITRAVVAEDDGGQWNELLRVDDHLKNSKGFLALNPLVGIAGWRIQYEQDPIKGLQLYFTPIQGSNIDQHLQPIGVAWNPATKRYQSLDRTYEHFLLESPSLEAAKSRLR